MTEIRFTEDADRDLIDIYLYGLAEYGLQQAEDYSAAMMAKINLVGGNPSFGSNYEHVRPGLRRSE
ncbi:MAG: type II toxin-antitoxin system RelE/ParE family toxin, partial [Pseudomonadota bacterium]